MTDSGFIIIPRCLFKNPLLQDGAYFHAWLWLVSQAAWKFTRVMVSNGRTSEIVELERGQLSHSRRYMAMSLGWSEKRVRTFLNRLQKVGMIDLQADGLQTVITIYDYDIYQGACEDEGRQTGPQTGRQRARKGPEEEESKEGNNSYSSHKAAKNPKGWPEDGFGRWYPLYPRKKDRGAAEKAFAKARVRGLIEFEELLAATTRYVECTKDRESKFIKHPAAWLNADSYLDEPDKPEGVAREATIAEPTRGPQSFSDSDWRNRLRDLSAKGEWSNFWGPRPGEPGCLVPARLLNGGAHGEASGPLGTLLDRLASENG
jgi:hypothetical protein